MTNESRPIWTEGICGDGAAILRDGVMQPIEEVIAALNAAELSQPEPEVAGLSDDAIEADFRSWYNERYHHHYFGAIPLVECIEWTRYALTRYATPQPAPEGVELPQAGTVESADAMEQIATETGLEWNCDVGMYLCSVHDLEAIARAVLTHFARPTIEPVPVAERPWEREGWCNSDNEAFFFDSDTKKWSLYECDKYSPVMTNASDKYTHSLPHNALPVPGAEVG